MILGIWTAKLVHKVRNNTMEMDAIIEASVCRTRARELNCLGRRNNGDGYGSSCSTKPCRASADRFTTRTCEVNEIAACDRHAISVKLGFKHSHRGVEDSNFGCHGNK
jgi:hypothetical protein